MPQEGSKVFYLIAILVGVDGVLAFALGGIVPGVLLVLAGALFFFSARLQSPLAAPDQT